MGTIKDRNIMDLTEAKNIMIEVARIHRRAILYKKGLSTQMIMMMWSLT